MRPLLDPICRSRHRRDVGPSSRLHDSFAALLCVVVIVALAFLLAEPSAAM